MPLYEYRCQSCSSISEIHHKISDPSPMECPRCGGGPIQKLISRTNFSLKGGGWYSEGYGSKTTKAEASETSSSQASSTKSTPEPASASTPGCGSGGCGHKH